MSAAAIDPRQLEAIAARAWPAAEQARIGGWRLYASSGYSGRINACWPLADPGESLAAAIAAVEAWYAARALPPLFKIIDRAAEATLIAALEARGYRARTTTLMMVGPLGNETDAGVRISDQVDETFAAVFASAGSGELGDTRERRSHPPRPGMADGGWPSDRNATPGSARPTRV